MEQAMWLSSIFGPMLLVVAVWWYSKERDRDRLWTSLKATPSAFYIGNMLRMLIGFSVLSLYSSFDLNLALFVTLFGYIQVIRSVWVLFYYETAQKMADKVMRHPQVKYLACVPFVWGLAFIKLGFFS